MDNLNLNLITPSTSNMTVTKSPPVSSKTMMLENGTTTTTTKPTITLMSPKTSPTTNNHVTKVTVENHCLQDGSDPLPSSEPNHVPPSSVLCRQHSKLSVTSNRIIENNFPDTNHLHRFHSLTEQREEEVACPRNLSNVSKKPSITDNPTTITNTSQLLSPTSASNKIHPLSPPSHQQPPTLGPDKDNIRDTSEIININCNDDISPDYLKGN